MARKGALESLGRYAALERYRHRSIRRCITLGFDGALEIGSNLPVSKYLMGLISQAFEGAGGSTREEPIGTAHDLRDGGGGAVRTEVDNGVSNIGQHEVNFTGVHNAQTRVLFSFKFVGIVLEVVGVAGGELGDVHLKLATAGPAEGHVVGKA